MFFTIGIYQPKTRENVGTLWRSAYQLGAAGIFVIGRRYKRQHSDTLATHRHIPMRNYESFDQFLAALPMEARLVGVETTGEPLADFTHPKQAVYLLGSEDNGLPDRVLDACHHVVSIEAIRTASYNVAVAGSIVMYHRLIRRGHQQHQRTRQ